MSKKEAPTPIEVYTREQALELAKTAGNMFSQSPEPKTTTEEHYPPIQLDTPEKRAMWDEITKPEPKPDTPPAEPQQHPSLTTEQKVQLLTLQRNAVVAQNQKFQADQQFEKAMLELNRGYQAVNTIQGFALNELTLDFVATS